ncbi:hypothetical protein C2E23DRAFT_884592 [Lenzites betulinus]|nr:hypothetical protein C2E23DRAFT_884592 [Lenzites betulinus]
MSAPPWAATCGMHEYATGLQYERNALPSPRKRDDLPRQAELPGWKPSRAPTPRQTPKALGPKLGAPPSTGQEQPAETMPPPTNYLPLFVDDFYDDPPPANAREQPSTSFSAPQLL